MMEGHMMEIIEISHKYAQAHRADSQRLMRFRDQHDELNLNMLRNLERIERKLEKESDTRKTGSHSTPERKIRLRSGSRHCLHSPKNSIKEAHSNSSPSPTRNHQISGVDELKGEMNKIKPPMFDGEHNKEEDAKTWLLGMTKYFQLQNYSSHAKGRIVMYQIKGKASMWWDQLV
jgi:hypothetical protein